MKKWIKLALKIAEQSSHNKYRMGAVIVSGGRVLSSASNFGRLGHKNYCGHAEARAIRKAGNCVGATIIICRIGMGISKPCSRCMRIIQNAKIDNIVYFNHYQQKIKERV